MILLKFYSFSRKQILQLQVVNAIPHHLTRRKPIRPIHTMYVNEVMSILVESLIDVRYIQYRVRVESP